MKRTRLDHISRLLFIADVQQYGLVPAIEPLADWQSAAFDHMDFDRQVCASGLKMFVRPTTISDQPDSERIRSGLTKQVEGLPNSAYKEKWIIVIELAPGVRNRLGVDLPVEKTEVLCAARN